MGRYGSPSLKFKLPLRAHPPKLERATLLWFVHLHQCTEMRREVTGVASCVRAWGLSAAPLNYASCVGLARTVYIHRIWPYVWWFPCQKYRVYTVYIWFWPTLLSCNACKCALPLSTSYSMIYRLKFSIIIATLWLRITVIPRLDKLVRLQLTSTNSVLRENQTCPYSGFPTFFMSNGLFFANLHIGSVLHIPGPPSRLSHRGCRPRGSRYCVWDV
jgi:hypothetical protein